MTELVRLQQAFQDYLFQVDDAILQHIVDTETVSAKTRLFIYQNAYYLRLLEALSTSYPILQKQLGADGFEEIGYDYIRAYASTYRSIRWFGDRMADFLHEHATYQSMPYLSELTAFEWMLCSVFDAADAENISLEEMGSVAPDLWESMRFTPHPSLHELKLEWNVVSVWQSLSDNETPIEFVKSDSPVSWILWRKDLETHFCSLPEDEAWAIHAMLTGQSFGEICEGLCHWHDEDETPTHAASLLKGWIGAGLIIGIYF
ncbi:MAG TPA: DNA-binding domain-containing protein [Gammaproteobacteria bacterium]|nr:DNA-binding domain-containing protein [Gammaproteobacteria bacterium]